MGDPKGFLKVKRQLAAYRPVCERVKDYREVCVLPSAEHSKDQASRCMDCGTPFCHGACPIGNYIPEWNDFIFHGHIKNALELLRSSNNLPEITGRICPALCEYACVLGINDEAITIRENELSIIESAFKKGLINPRVPKKRTGKKVAVIGSGPAGITCVDELNKLGHKVVVYERDDKVGGILRYGIPDFKLEKGIIDRRISLLKKEGVKFEVSVDVGKDIPAKKLLKEFDAICLAGGSRAARDLKIEGRDLKGIHLAMDYLIQSNKRINGEKFPKDALIDAKGKRVVVIGGGDTGSDCVGTAHRQGASCVVQVELLPKPSQCRTKDFPWPKYPLLLKVTSSHEEGGERHWAVSTKRFIGKDGRLTKLSCVRVEFSKDSKGCALIKEVPGSEFDIEADLVILAMGFVHPEHKGLLSDLGVAFDERGNVKTGLDYMTSQKSVFSCGDMHRGQSLVVWAIHEGRNCAVAIDKYFNKRNP